MIANMKRQFAQLLFDIGFTSSPEAKHPHSNVHSGIYMAILWYFIIFFFPFVFWFFTHLIIECRLKAKTRKKTPFLHVIIQHQPWYWKVWWYGLGVGESLVVWSWCWWRFGGMVNTKNFSWLLLVLENVSLSLFVFR